jgi:hypothetical protein
LDRERKQGFAESIRTYDAMVKTYDSLGYNLVEIPRVSVEGRVGFALHPVGSSLDAQSISSIVVFSAKKRRRDVNRISRFWARLCAFVF